MYAVASYTQLVCGQLRIPPSWHSISLHFTLATASFLFPAVPLLWTWDTFACVACGFPPLCLAQEFTHICDNIGALRCDSWWWVCARPSLIRWIYLYTCFVIVSRSVLLQFHFESTHFTNSHFTQTLSPQPLVLLPLVDLCYKSTCCVYWIHTYIRVCVYMYEHNECIVRGCYSLVLDHCSMFEEFSTFSRPSLLLPAMPLNLLTYRCHCRQQVSLSSSSIGIVVTVHPQTSLSLVCIPMCVCMYFGVYISVSW